MQHTALLFILAEFPQGLLSLLIPLMVSSALYHSKAGGTRKQYIPVAIMQTLFRVLISRLALLVAITELVYLFPLSRQRIQTLLVLSEVLCPAHILFFLLLILQSCIFE